MGRKEVRWVAQDLMNGSVKRDRNCLPLFVLTNKLSFLVRRFRR